MFNKKSKSKQLEKQIDDERIRADRYKEKSEAEFQRAEEELERAEHYKVTLKDVHEMILEEAAKLGRDRSFYKEVYRLGLGTGQNGFDARELVAEVIKELEVHFNDSKYLGQHLYQLEKIHSDLANEMRGMDSDSIRSYQKKIAGLEQRGRNNIDALESQIDQLVLVVDGLNADKRRAAEEQEAQRNEHGIEVQKLIDEYGARINELRRGHDLEKQTIESHLRDKILDQYATEQREKDDLHAAEVRSLKAKHEADTSGIKTELAIIGTRHEGEISRLKEEQKSKRADLKAKLETQQTQHESKVRDLEQTHGSTIDQMEKAHSATLQEMRNAHRSELEWKQEDHESRWSAMVGNHAAAIKQVEENHEFDRVEWNQARSKMQKEHKAQIAALQKDHEEVIAHMASEHRAECRKLNEQIAKLKKDFVTESAKQKSDFEAEKARLAQQTADTDARLKKDYREKSANIEKVHAAEREQLRKDRDAYSAALLARDKVRDKFEELKDVEIKAKFQELSQGVEKLARLEWRNDQGQFQVLGRLSPTPKLLMRQVLQDSIWVVLHEHIFCSPFRVFGEEGRNLESQWNEQCGADPALNNGRYTWPTPEVETERWRYVSVRECRAALRKPVPSEFDPRAKLKRGFVTALEELRGKLASTLGEVADINKSSMQSIKDLTMKATNIWLEFGMQRSYRIVVAIQDLQLESVEERIAKAQEDSLELVLVPALKSVTTSKSQDLQAEVTVIGGCGGEIVTVRGSRRG